MSSPHARGWSLPARHGHQPFPVFPACAGVVPPASSVSLVAPRLPRMRGGGPFLVEPRFTTNSSSPHARGWSRDTRPGTKSAPRLPRMRGGGPSAFQAKQYDIKSSPHARGWSEIATQNHDMPDVFPACAGVVPTARTTADTKKGLPRMRGGGPCLPTRQGVTSPSSPHARGWSNRVGSLLDGRQVFPACAGVVPTRRWPLCWPSRLPRMRGGGPPVGFVAAPRFASSPHARGWSRVHRQEVEHRPVFPACAGVVPNQ